MSTVAEVLGSLEPAFLSVSTGTAFGYQSAVFALILVATLVLLALERIHKAVLVLISAGICLLLADYWGYFQAHTGHLPVYVEMIEWEVIGIVVGATVFVEIAARSGVFAWISIKLLKLSRGDPLRLLVLFSFLTVVFSAFLDNITAMIIVGSLSLVACRKLELNPVPYLITEGIMTNVGGLLTLISSIPNIIIGKAADISYLTFLMVCTPYAIVAVAGSIWIARWLYGKTIRPLHNPAVALRHRKLVEAFDEWEAVTDRRFFSISIVAIVLVILAFALKPKIPVLQDFGIEVVALGAAIFMLLLHGKDIERDLEKVEWSMVFFFIGLFTVIGVMDKTGVLAGIGVLLAGFTQYTGSIGLMWLTALFSSVTDNIPLAAMLAKIFGSTPEAVQAVPHTHWWAVVFGANLGGNITPIGSASTVVAVTILRKHKLPLSFVDFVKAGSAFAGLQLVLASGYLLVLGVLL